MSDIVERAKAALEGIGESGWRIETNRHPNCDGSAGESGWRIETNRHPNCDGSAWGWISGVVNHWTWSDEKRLSRRQAEFVVSARTLVPELVAEVEGLRAEVTFARDGMDLRPMTEVESNLFTQVLTLRRELAAARAQLKAGPSNV